MLTDTPLLLNNGQVGPHKTTISFNTLENGSKRAFRLGVGEHRITLSADGSKKQETGTHAKTAVPYPQGWDSINPRESGTQWEGPFCRLYIPPPQLFDPTFPAPLNSPGLYSSFRQAMHRCAIMSEINGWDRAEYGCSSAIAHRDRLSVLDVCSVQRVRYPVHAWRRISVVDQPIPA